MTILCVEIGKSESKFTLFDHEKDNSGSIIITLGVELIIKVFETQYEVSALQNMLKVFLAENYDNLKEDIYCACFSIAAPVKANKRKKTFESTLSDGYQSVNLINTDFREQLPYNVVPVAFLNDMEAMGYDIFLGKDESILQQIHLPETPTDLPDSPEDSPEDSRALMLVSDGLGAAKWFDNGSLYPDPSEWGHGDFAARTGDEKSILQDLEARRKHYEDYSPVSREYVLSKRGLQRIYHSLENPQTYDIQSFSFTPEEIVEKGLQGDRLCKQSLDLFLAIWGAETGNLALTLKPEGGIYIVTDLPIPLAKFQEGSFMDAFQNKEPEKMEFRRYLNEIPIFLIQKPDMGIWGAARYAISKGLVTEGKWAIMRENQYKSNDKGESVNES